MTGVIDMFCFISDFLHRGVHTICCQCHEHYIRVCNEVYVAVMKTTVVW